MKSVAICGNIASGKSTLATKLEEEFFNNNVLRMMFAEPIKSIYKNRELLNNFMVRVHKLDISLLDTPISKQDSNLFFKEIPLTEYEPFMKKLEDLDKAYVSGTKPRDHYQFIGQTIKKIFNDRIWADILFNDYEMNYKINKTLNKEINGLLIDDLRMLIEFEVILEHLDYGFAIICLEIPEKEQIEIMNKNNLGTKDNLSCTSEIEVDTISGILKSFDIENYYEFEDSRRIIIHNYSMEENDFNELCRITINHFSDLADSKKEIVNDKVLD